MSRGNAELESLAAAIHRSEMVAPASAVMKNNSLHLLETEFSDNSDDEDFKATFTPRANGSYKSDENANLEDFGSVQLLSYSKSADDFITDSNTGVEEIMQAKSTAKLSSSVPLSKIESSMEPPPLPKSEPPPLPLSPPPPLPLSEPPEEVIVSLTSSSAPSSRSSRHVKSAVPSKLSSRPVSRISHGERIRTIVDEPLIIPSVIGSPKQAVDEPLITRTVIGSPKQVVDEPLITRIVIGSPKQVVDEPLITPTVIGSQKQTPSSRPDMSRRKEAGESSVDKMQTPVNNLKPQVYILRQGNNTVSKVVAKSPQVRAGRRSQPQANFRKSYSGYIQGVKGPSKSATVKILSDVDSSSINNQGQTKKQWGENIISKKEKDSNRQGDLDSEWADGVEVNLKLRKQRYEQHEPIKSTNQKDGGEYAYESAIDREVRLALERENRLKEEQQQREKEKVSQQQIQVNKKEPPAKQTMPITTVPPSRQHLLPAQTRYAQQTHKEVIISSQAAPSHRASPVAGHGSDSGRPESIIEREVREQQEREEMLRHEKGVIVSGRHGDKEREQSEYERQEKEQERIRAHESIIEREVRLQQECEEEIEQERQRIKGHFGKSFDRKSSREELSSPRATPQQPPLLIEEEIPDSRHHVMESSAGRQSASLASPSLTQIDQVHYEAAISSKAHAGESLIARELREMKEKEEEIRQMRRRAGMKVTEDNVDSWETPASESAVYNISHAPVTNRQKREAVQKSPSVDSGLSSASSTEGNRVTTPSRESRVKVQPWRDENEQDQAIRYSNTLRNETPVEREIRLARERDDELRRDKGLPPKQDSPDKSIPIELKTSDIPRPSFLIRRGEEEDQKGTMKKIATVRLQKEIESERHRELALRSEGKINTTSEERVGELMKYVEVIPSEPSSDIYINKTRGVTPTRTGVIDTKSTSHTSTQPAARLPNQQQEKVIELVPSKPRDEVDSTRRVEKDRSQPIRETAGRGQSRPPHSQSNGPVRHNATESKIEKELREMKEREDELRNVPSSVPTGLSYTDDTERRQRRIINREPYLELEAKEAEMSTEDVTSAFASHHMDEVQLRHRNQGDDPPSGKNVKRRSVLAEEWEKKFAGQM